MQAIISTIFIASAIAVAVPQDPATWAQCGGQGFSGSTACPSGYHCATINQWYSQCTADTSPSQGNPPSTGSGKGGSGLKWLGINESGSEWGTTFPGTEGTDFFFPSSSSIKTLISQGYNIIRVPFAMERMASPGVDSPLAQAYLAKYKAVIDTITSAGAYAIIDAHNYGRYNNAIITNNAGFKTFWTNVASVFKDNAKAIFDINNEYNTMPQDTVFSLNQAGIDGVRAAGATSQYIFVEGNMWSGTSTWATTNDDLKDLKDPSGKLVYEMHEYLNTDGSGGTDVCPSNTVGVDRVTSATAWLRANKKVGIIGEFAGGNNDVCKTAVTGFLDHLKQNSDVWLGAVWWSAGPAWPSSIYYDFEPPSGSGYLYYNDLLKKYLP